MKKVISLLVLSLMAASSFAADKNPSKTGKTLERQTIGGLKNTNRGFARAYGMAGCGFGSMVMGNKEGQILAATTNGTSFNQMFGITFGTLNCVGTGTHAKADQLDPYIQMNQYALADDIARAEGENVAVIAHLMGCPENTNLGSVLKANFSNIFSSVDLKPNEITDHIITVVGQDDALAHQCGIQI